MKNRRGEDDKVFRKVWEVVETKAEETRIAETKGGKRKEKAR